MKDLNIGKHLKNIRQNRELSLDEVFAGRKDKVFCS